MSFLLQKFVDADSLSLQQQNALLDDIKSALSAKSPFGVIEQRYTFQIYLPYNKRGCIWLLSSLSSNWNFKFQKKIELTIKMTQLYGNIPILFYDQDLHQFLKKINNSAKGVYFMDGSSTLIFRTYLDIKIEKNYIRSQIGNIFDQIQFKFWSFFLKFCIHSEIDCLQHLKQKNQSYMRLRGMKEGIELNRQSRQSSSICNLSDFSIKIVNIISQFSGIESKLKNYQQYGKIDKEITTQIYKKNQNKVMAKSKKDESSFVQSIEILKVADKQKIFNEDGAFGRLKRGLYYFKQNITINKNSKIDERIKQQQQDIQYSSKFLQKLIKKILIKKESRQKDNQIHKIQKSTITALRGVKCSIMGKYFLPKQDTLQSQHLFLEQYPQNMYQRNIKSNYSLKDSLFLVRNLAEGILFLWRNGFIHRDLKEPNVMIDTKGIPKIIDFGSSSKIYTPPKTQRDRSNNSNKLLSTKGYYYPYYKITNQHIFKNFSLDQFNEHQFFDVYSFGRILQNMFKLTQIHQDCIVHRQLYYLFSKCQEVNPSDRISPQQIVGYLNEIINLLYPGQNK